MPRKILFLSASLFCLSPVQGSALEAGAAHIISEPLAPAQETGRVLLVNNESAGAAAHSAKSMAGKAAKGVKNSAAATNKALTPSGGTKAKKANALTETGGRVKESLAKDKSALKTKAAKAEEKALKAEKKTAAATRGKSGGRKYKTKQAAADGKRTQRQKDFMEAAGGQNCVCVSGQYCVGPRGGHYCYTSGGHKRYLKRH